MKASKVVALSAAVFGLTLAPLAAHAEDSSSLSQCISNCEATHGKTGSLESDSKTKVSKKVNKRSGKTNVDVDVTVNERAPSSSVADSSNLESLRAEERARAAEQFRADEAKISEQHAADLERVRSEERTASKEREDAKIAAVRAEERARADQLLAQKGDGEVIKDAALTPVGLYGFVGGGGTGFTQPGAVGTSSVGGYWDARLGIGTRSIIGAEVSYVGGARDIQALGLQDQAVLVNNGVEGVARLNVPITPADGAILVEPYTFAGVGWSRFNLVNEGNNTSSVQSQDDIMTVPMGVGMQFGFNSFTLDLRGTYRHAIFSDLVGTSTSSFDPASLNQWGAGASLGFEF